MNNQPLNNEEAAIVRELIKINKLSIKNGQLNSPELEERARLKAIRESKPKYQQNDNWEIWLTLIKTALITVLAVLVSLGLGLLTTDRQILLKLMKDLFVTIF